MGMESNASPSITSFVIRFVVDETHPDKDVPSCYRGAIRHIQSDKEMNFSNWEDAVAFIQRYVPFEIESGKSST
jgi:hypothetical protein